MLDPGVWPGIEIQEWRAFAMHAASVTDKIREGRLLLFRGQARQWKLRASLLRSLPRGVRPEEALAAEKNALHHFQSQAHLYYPPSGLPFAGGAPRLCDWWALMQHHHAPTRLLDWSASPYVGAYFAADQEPGCDGVVLVIDGEKAQVAFKQVHPAFDWREDELLAEAVSPGVSAFTPFYKTTRLALHQGYFTMSLCPLTVHDDLLADAGAIVARWAIKADFKPELLHQLRIMNVAALTLFPGLDGLGRSAGELLRAPSIAPS